MFSFSSTFTIVTIAGTFARFNGSPFYMTRIPDLVGISGRKYIDLRRMYPRKSQPVRRGPRARPAP
jgi:hypothetical protein